MRQFPDLGYRTEVKALVGKLKAPHIRIGQAVCNKYQIPVEVESRIYESDNLDLVVQIICNWKGITQ